MLKKSSAINASISPEVNIPSQSSELSQQENQADKPNRQSSIVNRQLLWALLGALVLAAIYGRVALLNLTTGLVGGDLDGFENLWNNYWVKTALLDLHRNPFFTDYIYYPTGISLRFHTLNLFNGLLTMPFNLTLGWIPTTNLLFVLALAFTTFCAFLLIRDLVGNSWAAFGGAALFTYANHQVLGFFSFGQTEKLSAEWLPLYLFFMFRTLHGSPASMQKSNQSWRLYLPLSILTLVILSLTDWQYLIYAVFTTLLYFGFILCTRRSWAEKRLIFFKLAGIGGIYAALVAVPLLLPMIKEAAESPWLSVSEQSIYHSRDLLDFVKPGLTNPGYLALAIGLFGLVVGWRKGGRTRETGLFWGLAATLACILALGPRLIVNEQITDLPMPYQLLYKLPVLSTGRDPERFYTIAMLGFGILTAFGLRYLGEWLPTIRPNFGNFFRRERLLAAMLTLVFLFVTLGGFVVEAGNAPVYPPDWPAIYQELAKDKDNYAVLELPLFTEHGRGENTYQLYQVLHNKQRFGGRLARDHKLSNPNNFVKTSSLFHDLFLVKPTDQQFFYPEKDFLARTDYATQGLAILNYYKVRYIVIYKEALNDKDALAKGEKPRFGAILKQVLGKDAVPYLDDRLTTVYKVPPAPTPANSLTLDIGNGWSSSQSETGFVYRWADNKDNQPSEFYAMNLTTQPVRAKFSFTAFPFKQPRTLKVAINGYEAGTFRLDGERKPISIDITIPPGNNLITLSTPEPPLPTGDPKDARLLTFGAYDIKLTCCGS